VAHWRSSLVHDVVVTARDVNPKETHEGGQRLTGYVGNAESAGLNRHVVGDERALRERKAANPSWPRVLQAKSRGDA